MKKTRKERGWLKKTFKQAMDKELREHKSSFIVFYILRALVIVSLVRQIILDNYEGAFFCTDNGPQGFKVMGHRQIIHAVNKKCPEKHQIVYLVDISRKTVFDRQNRTVAFSFLDRFIGFLEASEGGQLGCWKDSARCNVCECTLGSAIRNRKSFHKPALIVS